MLNSGLKLDKHDGPEGLDRIEGDWLVLMEDMQDKCFYHYPDWFRAYFSSREKVDPPISFFTVHRDDRLVGVIPLQRKPGPAPWHATQLQMPVESQLYMPDCAIADSEDPAEVLDVVISTIGSEYGWAWDRLLVSGALENSTIAKALERQSDRKLKVSVTGACSVVHVRPYDEMLRNMKAKYRQNLNRSRRMIASLDNAEFVIVKELDAVMRTFEEFVELEAAGWKGGKGPPRGDILRPAAIGLNEKKRRFYESAVRSFAARGLVEVFCVRAEGKLIGAEIWLVLGNTCYALKTAYDEDFRRVSPGVMAFDLGYQHHAAAGDTATINTITSTPAVDDWLPVKLRVQSYELFNSTLRSRLFAAALGIRDVLRKSSG